MKPRAFLAGLAALAFAALAFADTPPLRLMRYPDVNNGKIVFSYQGDLWLVPQNGGRATRITVHDGFETHPKFSPDGKWIAFTGNYFGGTNVFVIPAEGGEPRQLTYHPSSATVLGWTPDSKYVVFSSNRTAYSRFYTELFKVSIDGKFPEKLPVDRGGLASFSPDGTQMVFTRHPTFFWWWKRYKGTFNQDLWLYDFGKKTFDKLTNYMGNDTWPMWGRDNKIYFVSDRNGVANLFAYDLASQKIQQVTEHTRDGVQWPSMSADGKWIVYENEGKLWLFDVGSRRTREVVVTAPTDDHFNVVAFLDPTKYIQDWDVSPHAKRVVFDARGEIFTVPVKNGDTRDLSRSTNARDQHPAWSPDGAQIAYVSDISGEQEIYVIDQKGEGKPKQLTKTGGFKYGLRWSPDGSKLLYFTHDHHLYLLDVGSRKITDIARNPVTVISDYAWSPDSRWVAYAFSRRNFVNDVYFYDIKSGKSIPALIRDNDDFNSVFSPDGKTLYFLSIVLPDQVEIHSVSLVPEEKAPYQKPEDEEEPEKKAEKEKSKEKKGKDKGKKSEESKTEQPPKVEVVFEGLAERVRRVPLRADHYANLQVAKGFLYFLAPMPDPEPGEKVQGSRRALYAFDLKELKTNKVADRVANYRLARKEKKLVVWSGKGFKLLDANGKKAKAEPISLANVSLKVDRRAEWREIFDEGWRMVRDHFYDPNFHGVDWYGVKKYYESLLPWVRTREELNWLMAEMVGELNASHQGVRGGDNPPKVDRYPVALLGAELEPDYKAGFYRFVRIYKGDKSSRRFYAPLDADYVKIREGDYLLAIDGEPVSVNENYLKYLVNKNKNHVVLTTNSEPSWKGAIKTRIKPITNDYSLRYKAWVDHNRQVVDKASDGKIGYIHLENMGGGDLENFKKWFQVYRYKEAIILDVRYNGGGGIDPQLIDMLERRQYQIVKERHSVPLERPLEGFYGKVVVLCNEYSFSDAEVFPDGFKVRKLGTLIGKQTLGFVIAVSPYRLIDGGTIRKTFIGLWEVNGTQLESRGAIPDISVENTPEDELAGRDPQLQKAIAYLMDEIAKHPRNFNYPTPIKPR
ncbi:MAG: hypothetical protein GXO73_09025 [Calditrichaeota bacterium]|nr:hypothetical protein [Calditrichota bacterium]